MDPSINSQASSPKRRRGRWVPYVLLALLAGMGLVFAWISLNTHLIVRRGAFQSPEMAAAQFSSHDVVGDLGGMPVTIPRHFANYVEYDGDPGFGEKRQGPRPQRTHQSKLRSFGFDVRYPDMAGLSSKDMYADKKSHSIYNTPWVSVGITTGAHYPGHGALDRQAYYQLDRPDPRYPRHIYTRLPEKEHGLIVYGQIGVNPDTQQPYREEKGSHDVFIYRREDGRITTYIRCSNVDHAAAPCKLTFSLEPDVNALVDISFRRTLLPEWRGLQESIRQLILSFGEGKPRQP